MSKHTPGPWFIGTSWGRCELYNDNDTIADLTLTNLPEDEANLRLIAAAPELLRYLEIAVDTIKGEYPEEQWPDYKVPEMEKLIAHVKSSNR